MKYNGRLIRHELKYYIDEKKTFLLRNVLKDVAKPDENMEDPNGYLISSIYFDDIYNSAMSEKMAGISTRRKFRIRSYNLDDSFIRLECKEKYEQYISKISAVLTRQEYNWIMEGNYEFLKDRPEEVCRLFFAHYKTRKLHPVVVVEYLREAYTLPAGNVRITFDKEISVSVGELDIFSNRYITHRVLEEGFNVLEVKYDDYLPEYIRQVICIAQAHQCAISKYVMCRDEKRKVEHR